MLVKTMQEKVDKLVMILESGQFSMREIAKIAIGMELNAAVTVLEGSLDMNPNQRYALAEIYKEQQDQLNQTN